MNFIRPTTALVLGLSALTSPAWAQEARITFPAEGQDVRGEITVRFEGIPEGGYAMVKLDNVFKTATAEPTYNINTFDNSVFPPGKGGDGPHTLSITTMNAQGRQVGQATVNFNVANNKVDPNAPGLRLLHWSVKDYVNKEVLRYRVFAESNATIEAGGAAGGEGGAAPGGAGGGAEGGAGGWLPAPLDFQVSALVRRVIRDVAMVDGSANIRSVVDRAFERQRESESGAAGEGGPGAPGAAPTAPKKKKTAAPMFPVKAPWNADWNVAQETGQYFVKMIQPTGEEINATRKAPTIALGDLLPTFPQGDVRPGSTWDTTMTFVADLSTRGPLTVRNAPMTFTAFETIPTPTGRQIRCAKLETRFRLPEAQAIEVAKKLAAKAGTGAGGAAGGAGEAGAAGPMAAGGTQSEAAEIEIAVARTSVARVLWFDIENRQVLRSEDIVDTYFEQEQGAAEGGAAPAAPPPGVGGEAAAPAEPTKVSYNLRVTTWLDDTIPPPTDRFNTGSGTAHSRDSVQDPPVSRVTRP
jgi:hypothetical protein